MEKDEEIAMRVKGKEIGSGRPCICVPVMEEKKEQVIKEIIAVAESAADMIEWRVDAFENVESMNAIRDVFDELAPIVKNTIFLFTFRSKKQGGLKELDYEKIYDLHQVAAESKIVDFIDVEYFDVDDMDREIHKLQKMGVKVITSHHDFDETPSGEVIAMLLEQMAQSGADIVKLAVMPNCTEDVLRLLEETNAFHNKYPKQLLITMSMGKLGVISRVSGETFGSCVTFGAGKNASAPGQIPVAELQCILDAISG